jgi:hypothetical protein
LLQKTGASSCLLVRAHLVAFIALRFAMVCYGKSSIGLYLLPTARNYQAVKL